MGCSHCGGRVSLWELINYTMHKSCFYKQGGRTLLDAILGRHRGDE